MRSADGAAPMPAGENFPHVHADHGLDIALHRMGISGLKELPVVSRMMSLVWKASSRLTTYCAFTGCLKNRNAKKTPISDINAFLAAS